MHVVRRQLGGKEPQQELAHLGGVEPVAGLDRRPTGVGGREPLETIGPAAEPSSGQIRDDFAKARAGIEALVRRGHRVHHDRPAAEGLDLEADVLAIDDAHDVHLVREFKYALGRDSLEVISGGIDEGETPLAAAQRELREEAGLVAGEWQELAAVDPFTTAIRCRNHLFLARGLSQTDTDPDDGEELSLVRLPFDTTLQMVLAGEISHAASCILLLRAARLLGR